MSVSTLDPAAQKVPLSAIRVGANVRDELDPAHVDDLAGSIALRGLIVPLVVRPSGDPDAFDLVAGHHRHAACVKLGLKEVEVTFRDAEGTSADTAAENIVRKQLTPLEEARAVQAMLDEGYTLDGAATVLGWAPALVSARAKILQLPKAAQQLIGSGEIPVSAVDNLLRIQAMAPDLVVSLAAAVHAQELRGPDLVRSLGWALGRAMALSESKVFAAYLNQVSSRDVESLKLGRKADAKLAEAEKLHKAMDRYAYGPPSIRFTEADIDQARAAGVLLELEDTAPIIVDRPLYRELCKQAIARTASELAERKAAHAVQQRELRSTAKAAPRTPKDELDVEHRAQLREFARRSHTVNLDLGAALLGELAQVDPADVNVARFFAYGLLGPERSNHLGAADNVARTLAANGLRLVLEQFRTSETPTLKSGKPGKTKVSYGEADDAQDYLWKFVTGAKTAAEIYGRVLVVFAAQHYALQIALPNSQRRGSILPRSHKDAAAKAFEKITAGVLPETYKQLTRAIAREASAYRRSSDGLDQQARDETQARRAPASTDHEDIEDVKGSEDAVVSASSATANRGDGEEGCE